MLFTSDSLNRYDIKGRQRSERARQRESGIFVSAGTVGAWGNIQGVHVMMRYM